MRPTKIARQKRTNRKTGNNAGDYSKRSIARRASRGGLARFFFRDRFAPRMGKVGRVAPREPPRIGACVNWQKTLIGTSLLFRRRLLPSARAERRAPPWQTSSVLNTDNVQRSTSNSELGTRNSELGTKRNSAQRHFRRPFIQAQARPSMRSNRKMAMPTRAPQDKPVKATAKGRRKIVSTSKIRKMMA